MLNLTSARGTAPRPPSPLTEHIIDKCKNQGFIFKFNGPYLLMQSKELEQNSQRQSLCKRPRTDTQFYGVKLISNFPVGKFWPASRASIESSLGSLLTLTLAPADSLFACAWRGRRVAVVTCADTPPSAFISTHFCRI